jgi:hypothetical protein
LRNFIKKNLTILLNKFMKKSLSILFLIAFIIPSVAFASWWNPFSWFNSWSFHKETPPVVVVQPQLPPSVEVVQFPHSPSNEPTPEIKKEAKKEILKPQQPTIIVPTPTPVYVPPPAPVVVAPVELSIYDISIDEESNSARVSWKTNIISESKVILEGKSYFSKRGVGTEHYTDIGGLESDLYYGGTITAIANNAWKNQNFNFTTKDEPPTFEPKVTLDKSTIKNDGNDRIEIKIRTVNDNGIAVPNKNIEITTSIGSGGVYKETKTDTVTSDSNGDAIYNTPTTTAYDRCGVSMSITVKIDNNSIFGQTVSIHNTKQVQSGGGACA